MAELGLPTAVRRIAHLVVGSEIAAIGYPLLVLAVTGSPAQAGLVAFAETLSAVLAGLPAGALVDR